MKGGQNNVIFLVYRTYFLVQAFRSEERGRKAIEGWGLLCNFCNCMIGNLKESDT